MKINKIKNFKKKLNYSIIKFKPHLILKLMLLSYLIVQLHQDKIVKPNLSKLNNKKKLKNTALPPVFREL